MEAFAFSNSPLDTFPALQLEVAKLNMLEVSERKAETPHARVKTVKGFRRAGPLAVSNALRMPFLEAHLNRDLDIWKELSRKVKIARKPAQIIQLLGFQNHPLLRNCPSNRLNSRLHHVTYRADSISQHQDRSGEINAQGGLTKAEAQVLGRLRAQQAPRPPVSAEAIRAPFMLLHFLDATERVPTKVFSMPVDANSQPACTLVPLSPVAPSLVPLESRIQMPMGVVAPGMPQGHVEPNDLEPDDFVAQVAAVPQDEPPARCSSLL